MFEYAIETLEKMGFEQYEISAFAREKKRSQHNLGYWTGKNFLAFFLIFVLVLPAGANNSCDMPCCQDCLPHSPMQDSIKPMGDGCCDTGAAPCDLASESGKGKMMPVYLATVIFPSDTGFALAPVAVSGNPVGKAEFGGTLIPLKYPAKHPPAYIALQVFLC